ncbi:hypothetical protein EYS09_03785 [Streptomyces kasugaensis]|uniref:Uncharacterized protein n=1 Tax=Streptomyces kasugaensis TaxID=1946 RepID=A0A4Q9I065_STRKA|nr:hypothetical protein EYS09_03785 [Streptomyces kasugaensis]
MGATAVAGAAGGAGTTEVVHVPDHTWSSGCARAADVVPVRLRRRTFPGAHDRPRSRW